VPDGTIRRPRWTPRHLRDHRAPSRREPDRSTALEGGGDAG